MPSFNNYIRHRIANFQLLKSYKMYFLHKIEPLLKTLKFIFVNRKKILCKLLKYFRVRALMTSTIL